MDTPAPLAGIPVAPFPTSQIHWLRLAWLAAGCKTDRNGLITGAVAIRGDADSVAPERVLAIAGDRRHDQHSGIASLLVQCASHGISLRGATCFLWPGLGRFQEFEQLLDCGIKRICIPGYRVPKRLEEDEHQCRWRASCVGVPIETIDPDLVFKPLQLALEENG